ncbi:hypothetical protein P12x_000796 [Tundrisphaera lichenicola]|uniref:hypothetical protein n=1 Tax=Tundrisphaera lichenicola TaxID=2029860 RepID=UPI003EBCE7A4
MVAKAALVSLAGGFLGPLPNVIVFQYNPAELTRNLQQKRAPACGSGEPTQAEAFRVDGPPNETISLKAEFDGDDLGMDGNPITPLFGIRPALAALEMLLYSKEQQALNPFAAAAPAGSLNTPPDELPLVLFVWGPGRVLPVRLSGMNIKEQEFDRLLNPIRAEVELTLEIQKRLPSDHPARGVYDYTERQMRVVARLQMVNNVQSILGALPVF